MSTTASDSNVPPTLLEAFASTAAQLRHFGIPRVRVVGLSSNCTHADYEAQRHCADGKDIEILLLESALRGPHGALGTASYRVRVQEGDDVSNDANAPAMVADSAAAPIVTESEFMHKFVFHSRPCVIVDALREWPAMQKWRNDRYVFDLDHHLPLEPPHVSDSEEEEEAKVATNKAEKVDRSAKKGSSVELAAKQVTVALTPNGRADAVTRVTYSTADVPAKHAAAVYTGTDTQKRAVLLPLRRPSASCSASDPVDPLLRHEKIFMYAAERRMTLPGLYRLLQRSPVLPPPHPIDVDMRSYADPSHTPVVAYAQLQNNCLNTEYTHLHVDLGSNVEAFGCRVFDKDAVEAANVWFGIPASVSSMHQDWVENLYSVVRGVKEFVLLPPWEGPFIPKPEIPAAAFALVHQSETEGNSPGGKKEGEEEEETFQFETYPMKDGTTVPWMDFDLTGADIVDDAEGHATAELTRRLYEKRRARSALWASPMSKAEAHAAAAADAAQKPLHPLVAYVHPGETLYLPAMWLHRVAQHADYVDEHARAVSAASKSNDDDDSKERAVNKAAPLPLIAAVNYWYDMSFTNPSVVLLREFGLLI